MVKAIINIKDETNRVLNIVKAKYGLRDKSEAINMIAEQYEEYILEPQLKPEYVEKIKSLEKSGKFREFNSIDEFEKEIKNA